MSRALTIPTKETVWEGGSPHNIGRVVGNDGSNITQASVASASYLVASSGSVVISETALTVANVVYDTLQTDSRWTKDSTGYNFRHQLAAADLPNGGTTYLVQYKLVDQSGFVSFLEFELDTREQYFD